MIHVEHKSICQGGQVKGLISFTIMQIELATYLKSTTTNALH